MRDAGIALRPTGMAFAPWTTLEDHREVLRFIDANGSHSLRLIFARSNPKRQRGRALQKTLFVQSRICEAFALADASGYFGCGFVGISASKPS